MACDVVSLHRLPLAYRSFTIKHQTIYTIIIYIQCHSALNSIIQSIACSTCSHIQAPFQSTKRKEYGCGAASQDYGRIYYLFIVNCMLIMFIAIAIKRRMVNAFILLQKSTNTHTQYTDLVNRITNHLTRHHNKIQPNILCVH